MFDQNYSAAVLKINWGCLGRFTVSPACLTTPESPALGLFNIAEQVVVVAELI